MFIILKRLKEVVILLVKMTDQTTVLMNELQARVAKQDFVISQLKVDIDRLKEKSKNTGPVMRTSIPLNKYEKERSPRHNLQNPRERRQKVAYPTMSLSDVIESGEEVTIRIKDKKEGEHFEAVTVFDGTNLEVTECNMASLLGMKSTKPGEILYKFMEELHSNGCIDRTFGVAPWRLCFVTRGSSELTLEELRPKN